MGTIAGMDAGTLRFIRLWCRRRADRTVGRGHEMEPYWLHRTPHEEARCQLGMTVHEYRFARRWLDRAAGRAKGSDDHLRVSEALHAIADEHVELVMRYGVLREERCLIYDEIRDHLGLAERDLDQVAEWWRDALAAARDQRNPDQD